MEEREPAAPKDSGTDGFWGACFSKVFTILLGLVALVLLILTLYFALRPRPVRIVERVLTPTPLPTTVPQLVPPTSLPVVPTVTNTPTSIYATSTPLPDPVLTPLPRQTAGGETCQKSGLAWDNANRVSDELYGETTLGDSQEQCWLVGQIWTDQRGRDEVWVFAIPPGEVVAFANYRGGTAWYFSGNQTAVQADLAKQEEELRARDPNAMVYRVFLPEQVSQCPLVVRGS